MLNAGIVAVDRHLLLADDRRASRRRLPTTLHDGLTAHGVPARSPSRSAQLPPVGSLFAAFLGYNPIQTLLGPTGVLRPCPPATQASSPARVLPAADLRPFHDGLVVVFGVAAVMSLIGAVASFSRGRHYVHTEENTQADARLVSAREAR